MKSIYSTKCGSEINLSALLCRVCALTPLVGQQEGHLACKKLEWSGAGVVICLERGADLHMAQLMPLPLTVSCFSKIQIGFTFLVPVVPDKGPLNGCVCSMQSNQNKYTTLQSFFPLCLQTDKLILHIFAQYYQA